LVICIKVFIGIVWYLRTVFSTNSFTC